MSSAHGPVSALTPTSQSSPPSRLTHGGFCPDCCPVQPHDLFCRADSGHRAHRGTLMCLSRAPDSCLLCPRPEVHWDSFSPLFPGGKMLGVLCGGRRKPAARVSNAGIGRILFIPHLDHRRYLTSSCSVALRPEVQGLFPTPHTPCTHPVPCFQPTCHPQRSQTQRSSKTGALWGP